MKIISLKGKVVKGRQDGGKLGFPTINIPVAKSIKKSDWGIYFSLVRIDGKQYPGATFLGPAKITKLYRPTCETYLITLKKDLYGEKVEKKLLYKFREVEHYENVSQLKKQMKKDIKQAKKYFGL